MAIDHDLAATIELKAVTSIEVVFELSYTPNGSNILSDIQANAGTNFQANGFVSGGLTNLYIVASPTTVRIINLFLFFFFTR
jgi:hypothetical protein